MEVQGELSVCLLDLFVRGTAIDTKNLVIVGGPVVNGMSTLTKEELEAAADNYIVRKEGTKIMVAGYLASDTKEAGDALIQWLKDNAHA